jgi:hypothetical protein
VTTHGRRSIELRAQPNGYGLSEANTAALRAAFDASGFGFTPYEAPLTYGHSVSRSDWVLKELPRVPGLDVGNVAECARDHHQDVCACVATEERLSMVQRVRAARRRHWGGL